MNTQNTRLVEAEVKHSRHRQGEARNFAYKVFYAYVDLDELDELGRTHRLFSARRSWIYSLQPRDFLDSGQGSIKANLLHWLTERLKSAGKELPQVRSVQVLAHLRSFSYNFNPLSVFFVDCAAETLCLAEVHNTFGEAKRFLLNPLVNGRSITRVKKFYYVSPFIEHDNDFTFDVRRSAEGIDLRVTTLREETVVLTAELKGRLRPFRDRALLAYLGKRPLMPLMVMAAIHWQALKMMAKGIPYFKKSEFPEQQKDYYASKAISQHRS